MFELILLIGTAVVMGKIAEYDDGSPWIWGGVTLLLCIASLFLIPWPFLRLLIAGVVAFVAMIVCRVATDRA